MKPLKSGIGKTNRKRQTRRPVDEILKPAKVGRRLHEATPAARGFVRMLVLLGRTQDEIAAAGGIDRKTLAKHYRDDLDKSFLQIGAELTETGLKMAMGGMGDDANWREGNPGMVQYFLSRRFGFNDPVQRHIVANYDLENLSIEELENLHAILDRAAIKGSGVGGSGEETG